ncbi:MAG TPA: M20 family metallopeptidase [Kofleriaceae bacterium]|nr:M20 family metallopeptidase [Kofleriaceae bacterium]
MPENATSSALSQSARQLIDDTWQDAILPALSDYIRIPNKSPMFDAKWREHGHMDAAVALIAEWCKAHGPAQMTTEVLRLPGKTPLIFMEVPATGSAQTQETVILYGHLDKQPEMTGWDPELSPWTPVMRGDRLYGRGSADDGYAAFASVTAARALAADSLPHPRLVILIEAGEESGSPDLPDYIDHLADRIGSPSLVVCLDSGCGNYDQMWLTTSLRGMASMDLRVEILTEGVHSGDASGIVASTFRIARLLLSRLEDPATGTMVLPALFADIPGERRAQAQAVAAALGTAVYDKFPFVDGAHPVSEDLGELILNRTWRPTLSITGAGGLPALADAGNVLRPHTALKLSLRLPPTVAAAEALREVKACLTTDVPYGARVTLENVEGADGWSAPAMAPWLTEATTRASRAHFGADPMLMGEGGSIPFMAMLGDKFPQAQFVITGVLGPGSNAHGPNEFLHIPTGRRLTACVADILAACTRRG